MNIWVRILVVVCVLVVVAGYWIPSRFTYDEQPGPYRSAKRCIANLAQLRSAQEQWALDQGKEAGAKLRLEDVVGTRSGYIKSLACPDGGAYPPFLTVGINPTCSMGRRGDSDPWNDHVLP